MTWVKATLPLIRRQTRYLIVFEAGVRVRRTPGRDGAVAGRRDPERRHAERLAVVDLLDSHWAAVQVELLRDGLRRRVGVVDGFVDVGVVPQLEWVASNRPTRPRQTLRRSDMKWASAFSHLSFCGFGFIRSHRSAAVWTSSKVHVSFTHSTSTGLMNSPEGWGPAQMRFQ